MRGLLFVAIAVGAAGCAYHPGSFATTTRVFPGEHSTVGCIDLALDRRDDYEGSAVFDFSFGNRCNQPAMLDFGALAVWATTSTGEQIRLYPYDPNADIRPLPIEGRLAAHEVIAYPLSTPATRVCIDANSIAHVAPPDWRCWNSKEPLVVAQEGEAP